MQINSDKSGNLVNSEIQVADSNIRTLIYEVEVYFPNFTSKYFDFLKQRYVQLKNAWMATLKNPSIPVDDLVKIKDCFGRLTQDFVNLHGALFG